VSTTATTALARNQAIMPFSIRRPWQLASLQQIHVTSSERWHSKPHRSINVITWQQQVRSKWGQDANRSLKEPCGNQSMRTATEQSRSQSKFLPRLRRPPYGNEFLDATAHKHQQRRTCATTRSIKAPDCCWRANDCYKWLGSNFQHTRIHCNCPLELGSFISSANILDFSQTSQRGICRSMQPSAQR
jgi:hypothetical protein